MTGTNDDDMTISHRSKRHKDDEGWQSQGDQLLQIVMMREMRRECAWVQKCNILINVNFTLEFIVLIPNSSPYGNLSVHHRRHRDPLHLLLLLLIGDVVKFGPPQQRPWGWTSVDA